MGASGPRELFPQPRAVLHLLFLRSSTGPKTTCSHPEEGVRYYCLSSYRSFTQELEDPCDRRHRTWAQEEQCSMMRGLTTDVQPIRFARLVCRLVCRRDRPRLCPRRTKETCHAPFSDPTTFSDAAEPHRSIPPMSGWLEQHDAYVKHACWLDHLAFSVTSRRDYPTTNRRHSLPLRYFARWLVSARMHLSRLFVLDEVSFMRSVTNSRR
ncbi:hypothetical protein OH76DRAFT_162598 [Lentinus brumalis]|uniref:Uncharacterized protein n=1 Tax=Lentinus brumalis TaxID=2498619 RepID=A0A371DIZ1_9APHY|nr:hypothetical protein OH76DRAFT_162598 [Polyporus brumalis]